MLAKRANRKQTKNKKSQLANYLSPTEGVGSQAEGGVMKQQMKDFKLLAKIGWCAMDGAKMLVKRFRS